MHFWAGRAHHQEPAGSPRRVLVAAARCEVRRKLFLHKCEIHFSTAASDEAWWHDHIIGSRTTTRKAWTIGAARSIPLCVACFQSGAHGPAVRIFMNPHLTGKNAAPCGLWPCLGCTLVTCFFRGLAFLFGPAPFSLGRIHFLGTQFFRCSRCSPQCD